MTSPQTLDDALAECLRRLDAEGSARVRDWAAAHPLYTSELAEFLSLCERADDVFTPTRSGNAGNETALPCSFGEYQILSELGRGGMGVVLKARHGPTGRVVALKLLRLGKFASPEERRRFRVESEACVSLDHPGIVPVYTVAEADGQPYLTMRLLTGGTLAERRAEFAEPRAAARLLIDLAAAVDHAHRRGILHRDLKPSNVLFDDEGRPHLSDFGLARIGAHGDLTRTGVAIGTPAYMAPEQRALRPGQETTATDVHGLGAVLYELLTGRPPYRMTASGSESWSEFPVSPPAPRSLRPAVPADMEAVCLTCLDPEPERRYATAAALADDLRRFLDGRPTAARPLGRFTRAARWARRRPDLAVGAVGVVAGLVAAVGFGVHAAVARNESEVARRVAADHEFYATLERIRQRRAETEPGWGPKNLDDLKSVAGFPRAAEVLADLRSEAAAALTWPDFRPAWKVDGFPTYSVAYSADGRHIALGGWGSRDGAVWVRIVDAADGRTVREVSFPTDAAFAAEGKSEYAASVAFSPDGRWLAASSRFGAVHIWDLAEPQPRPVTRRARPEPGGPMIAFGGRRPTLYATVAHKKKNLLVGWGADGWGEVIRLNPDGVPGPPLVDRATGDVVYSASGRVLTGDGRTLAIGLASPTAGWGSAGAANGAARILAGDVAGGFVFVTAIDDPAALQSLLPAHPESITSMGFTRDAAILVSSSEWSRHVTLWDVCGGRLLADRLVGDGGSMRLAVNPHRNEFVAAADRRAVLYRLVGSDASDAVGIEPYPVDGAAVSRDGTTAILIEDPPGRPGKVSLLTSSSNGRWSATRLPFDMGDPHRPVVAIDPRGHGAVVQTRLGLHFLSSDGKPSVPKLLADVKQARYGPDGRLWCAATGHVTAYETPSWREAATYVHDSATQSAADIYYTVAPGAGMVLAGRRNGKIVVLDSEATQRSTWAFGEVPVTALDLNEATDLAVAGDENGHVGLFRLSTGEVLVDLPTAHRDHVEAAVIAPDGRWFATGGRDRAIRFWTPGGVPLMTLRTTAPVKMLTVTETGTELYALVSGERGLRRWRLDRLDTELRDLGLGPLVP